MKCSVIISHALILEVEGNSYKECVKRAQHLCDELVERTGIPYKVEQVSTNDRTVQEND